MKQSTLQFIETIRLQGGILHHLALHQARVDRTLAHYALPPLDLKAVLSGVESQYPDGLYKCRVLYGATVPEVDVKPYTPLIRHRVSLVESNIDYAYKSADRAGLNALLRTAGTDDIIIVKDGLVTDSAIANLVFESSQGLFTPRVPLLEGVQRSYLLQSGQITPMDIRVADLRQFDCVHFINAMVPLGTIAPFALRQLSDSILRCSSL